jgi:transposase InsO family protein
VNLSKANPLTLPGTIAGRKTQLLIDTGASLSLINRQLFYQLSRHYQQQAYPPPPNLILQLADRSRLHVDCALSLPITIENSTRIHTVYVVPQLWRSCIIGNDLIKKHDLQIDGGRQRAYFKQVKRCERRTQVAEEEKKNDEEYTLLANERIKIPAYHAFNIEVRTNKPLAVTYTENNHIDYEITSMRETPCVASGIIIPRNSMTVQVANLSEEAIIIYPNQPLATMTALDQSQINTIEQNHRAKEEKEEEEEEIRATSTIEPNLMNTSLNTEQKEKLQQLISSYPDVFKEKAGRTAKMKHQINLLPGARPCNSPPFRYAPARRQIIEDNLREMTEEGIISPSKSPWASPVILAPKKDGTLRFCVDYRKLNSMTVKDAYPIPRIDDTLDSLQEAKFVSTLDLRSGYWQVAMEKDAREKTAFVTHKGLFEFNVMPFGLTNAPATFQRLMDIVLAGLKWQCCLVYIDDIVIYSPTFEQHLIDLKNVFQALKVANLTLKANKCQFCREEMSYLGHIITQNGIKPDPGLVKSVTKFPEPRKVKDVQSFLGLTGYYRRFIKDYAKIAEPLLRQLRSAQRSNHHLKWTRDCALAMETLKERLTNSPIMNTPNFNYPFILELDACEYGLGGVLSQEYEGKKYVIAYASRTLSTPERRYGATEREGLAIVWATKHFRPYLEGHNIFIRSDCKALEWMRTAKDVTGRLARWAMQLSSFQIEEIKYRPGKSNANADSLSRNPLPTETENVKEISNVETVISIWENTSILDNIRTEQEKDSKLQPIIKQLRSQPPPATTTKRSPYILINDRLYKVKNSNRGYNVRVLGNKHLVVIPKTMQHKLLQWAHDHPTAGHGGQQRTLFRLSTRVFWESMRKDIFKYINACPSCQQFKYNNAPTASPMQMHVVNEPWITIGIDIMGPFPTTLRNKRFLLVVVDYFTRWVELFSLRSTTSTDIANILTNEVFSRFGIPRFIVSDNGPQFVSNLFQNFCETLNIKQNLTANYHPQSNMTERVNRTLKPMIAIYAQQQPQSWDKEIQKLAFAIRSATNETTGETPAFMMFGRDIRGPIDILLGESTATASIPTTPDRAEILKYKENLVNNLKNAYHLVKEHSEIKKLQQKTNYDQHTTEKRYTVGDLVWVAVPTKQINDQSISGKLMPRYQGPCRLVEQLTPITFTVQRVKDNVNLGATNVDRLKPYQRIEMNEDQSRARENETEDEREDEEHQSNTRDIPRSNRTSRVDAFNSKRVSNRSRRVPLRYQEN